MLIYKHIKLLFIVVSSAVITFAGNLDQRAQPDSFRRFIQETVSKMPTANSGIYAIPDDNDYNNWRKIFWFFRNRSYDSCKQLLAHYNYELIQLKDVLTDNVYDIIREKYPIQRGWGTYIYNRNYKKRLYIHINHPIDDPHAINIGTEIFRQLKAEWYLIAGTSRKAIEGKLTADVGRIRKSIFQWWHEMLSSLTYVALSIHSYDEKKFPYPINLTDIIISNGRTTDDQWGVSQLSLAFRDTMRFVGYPCALAMYDSGYARLAGGWNMQGIFSNDSIGFGHWLYVELSRKVRERPWEYTKLISAMDRALELTGKKISHQVNRAFGLVSPRVIKVDSLRRLFFPPENVETYRIVSFDPKKNKNDTIDVRMGDWMNLFGSQKSITAVTVLDTSVSKDYSKVFKRPDNTTLVSKIIDTPKRLPSIIKFKENETQDSTSSEEDEERIGEPLQVHRIPLQPVLRQTFDDQSQSDIAPFKWEGMVEGYFAPTIQAFDVNDAKIETDDIANLPRFLIPLISSSFKSEKKTYLGVQMTTFLVSEIARLVTEYQVTDKDIGLIAEQSDGGEYYLRIFPSIAKEIPVSNIIR